MFTIFSILWTISPWKHLIFFPRLKSQLFCQLLLPKPDYFSNSGLSITIKIFLLLPNHFRKVKKRPQFLLNSVSRVTEHNPGLSQWDEIDWIGQHSTLHHIRSFSLFLPYSIHYYVPNNSQQKYFSKFSHFFFMRK